MGDKTGIEWADATWNPVRGCTRMSEGCRNCYAEIMAARFSDEGMWGQGFAEMRGGDHRWTGKVALIESQLEIPLRWTLPRRIFVNSTSDLFHEALPDAAIDRVLAVIQHAWMAATVGRRLAHQFLVLTKRGQRLRQYFAGDADERVACEGARLRCGVRPPRMPAHLRGPWPLPNLWLGVSIENQATADERIPPLLQTPAPVHFLSCEPLLGPLDLRSWMWPTHWHWAIGYKTPQDAIAAGAYAERKRQALVSAHARFLDWVIAGGESGPGARPMHPDWARALRDQCAAAGVPFFHKQNGEWAPGELVPDDRRYPTAQWSGEAWHPCSDDWVTEKDGGAILYRLGKKAAGRLLDGVEHNGFPVLQ